MAAMKIEELSSFHLDVTVLLSVKCKKCIKTWNDFFFRKLPPCFKL